MGGGGERYWDGIAWSEHFTRQGAPAPGTAPGAAGSFGQANAGQIGQQPNERVVVQARKRSGGTAILPIVVGLIAAIGVFFFISRDDGVGWESKKGKQVRSGFVDGCKRSSAGAPVDCECIFTKITALPAYDTPDEFVEMSAQLTQNGTSLRPQSIPPEIMQAVQGCVG
jgi:hypothetical protein